MNVLAAADLARPVPNTSAPQFYVRIAAACVVVAAIGFAPTYWLPLFRGSVEVPPIVHVHAAVFYAWTLLFLFQTWLVANGRLTHHRAWGVFGVALATTMCFVGMAAAISRLKQSTAAGFGEATQAFTIIPVSGIAFFAVLFLVALLRVGQPQTHKRLMLVATVSLLQAPVGRWFLIFRSSAPTGGALLAVQVLRVPLSTSAAWTRIAEWLLTLSL
jgi:uncharacterized membrane protein YozB (DUF420 family)